MKTIMKRENGLVPAAFNGFVNDFYKTELPKIFNDEFWSFSGLPHRNVPVNIRETDKTYELQVMAPGFKKEDFKLRIADKLLTISLERKQETTEEDSNGKWLRSEYKLSSFSRSFNLDDNIDQNGISARYADGVLAVILPKKPEAQQLNREITIE